MTPSKSRWSEYDDAADWCARRNLQWESGDPLPPLLSPEVLAEINADPEAFAERVRLTAYANAMNSR